MISEQTTMSSEPVFFEKVQGVCCSKPVLGISVIVALALALIGSLALTGILYPNTPFAALGNTIGQPGSIAMLSSGGAAALLILAISACSYKKTTKVLVASLRAY